MDSKRSITRGTVPKAGRAANLTSTLLMWAGQDLNPKYRGTRSPHVLVASAAKAAEPPEEEGVASAAAAAAAAVSAVPGAAASTAGAAELLEEAGWHHSVISILSLPCSMAAKAAVSIASCDANNNFL